MSQPTFAHNPFATRFVRPGARPYRFSEGETAAKVVERLKQFGWRGQIVGPHGSGKSSLCQTLLPWLEQSGKQVLTMRMTSDDHRLRQVDAAVWSPAWLLLIDGFEQLTWVQRQWLLLKTWWHQTGLLITTHRSHGLPVLYRTAVSLDMAQQLVGEWLSAHGYPVDMLQPEVQSLWEDPRLQGNFRELLFTLYDLFQRRRASCTSGRRGD